MMLKSLQKDKSLHWWALLFAFITAVCVFVPIMVRDGGYFTYYGDFNVQQIPFYIHAHEMVRSGSFGWDWHTDLGANFIGSYSFYLLFSPFFWLTVPLPVSVVPYMMGPLFILKFSCAAFTSYFWFHRFVEDKRWAVVGALLYAFSGYSIYNVFFNHFHECIVFFPLMLVGLESLLNEDKHWPFILGVAINAMVNYWFFIGEVVFVILYVLVRLFSGNFEHRLKKFIYVAVESALGLGLAAVTLIPSVLAIMGNPRTTFLDNVINGWSVWLYYSEQRVPAIIASFFFPPDMPSRQNMFTDQGAQWASMAGWLPLFGMAGVIAYMRSRKNDWLRNMIFVCITFAMIPGLNALFILLNNSYYDRWFYMFEMMLVLATIRALEHCKEDDPEPVDMRRGFVPSAIVLAVMSVAIGLTPQKTDDGWTYGLMKYPEIFYVGAGFAVVCLLMAYLLWKMADRKYFTTIVIGFTAFVCAVYGILYTQIGYSYSGDHKEITDQAIGLVGKMELPDPEGTGNYVRADFYDCFENLNLFWEMPSIRCFHSIVPVSVMEFYPEVSVTRDVSSKPSTDLYDLRSFLSVRWLFIEADNEEQSPMPGFKFYETQNGYNIYENENYVPMGFTYNNFITEEQFEEIPEESRSKVLMSAIVLNDMQVKRYADRLSMLKEIDYYMSYNSFTKYASERAASASSSFKVSSNGFTCNIKLKHDDLVFFSVPYDKGWTAYVNGVETAIEKVNVGFMAVPADRGDNVIEFRYETPGLKMGAMISSGFVFIAAAYVAAMLIIGNHKKMEEKLTEELYEKEDAGTDTPMLDEGDAPPEEDLTVIRKPEDVPPPKDDDTEEEKIYPEL